MTSRVLCALLLLFPVAPSVAQQSAPPPRKKIGLVLSGGGARGLAHLGVLRWLDEHRIPVDYITGTSMGALVGSLYATGLDARQRSQFISGIDWDKVLQSEPAYPELSFRRKEDRRNYEIGARLGLKHGLAGPNGFSPGMESGLVIDRINFPYSSVDNFDDLPVPFRCVATDMLRGTEVVLQDGSLSQALRATMAIPGVFTPVEWKGTLLSDGGLVDNIPTDVARNMGAEVVIAVNVGTPLLNREELQSVSGVLVQSIAVMTLANDQQALALADIVITPDLANYSILDFSPRDEITRRGYAAAQANAAKLLPYALSESDWQDYLAARATRKRQPETRAHALEVTGVQDDQRMRLQKRLRRVLDSDLNLSSLERRLDYIAGDGLFDRLGYEGYVQKGVAGLRIPVHEKTYGPPFLDLAVDVSGSGVGAFNFTAGARLTFMDVARHGGEWRNQLTVGSSSLAATEFYQPLGASHFFVAPFAFASKTARNGFNNDRRVGVFDDARAGGGLDVGFSSGRRSELRFGYELYAGKISPIIGASTLPSLSGTTGQLRLRFVYDGQDSPSVPSRGERLVATLSRTLQTPGSTNTFDQLQVDSLTFAPISRKNSLFFAASLGTTFNGDAGPFQLFSLGGPFRLGAYFPDEFLGNHFAYASIGFRREIYRLPPLVGNKVYWASWLEAGTVFDDPSRFSVKSSLNLGIIAETFVGPIALSGAVSPSGKTKINFSIGRLF
ncbi:MAG: patatin-like phospholipase family protein [Acidobacteriia bacterium]|nr:patatin-like phospholipase family protein [Terriglobia bacterium]